MLYKLIEISYEGFSGQKKQEFILEGEFFENNKKEIEDALLDNFWAYDMDGEHNHVQGKYKISDIDGKDILNILSKIKKEDKELEQILKFEVEIGYEILENMEKVLFLHK